MSAAAVQITWENQGEGLRPFVAEANGTKTEAAWAPQPGSQQAFLECPVPEVLYEGTRGPGKTEALLVAFARHVGQGYGKHWRGIIFRRTFPELRDIIGKSLRLFPKIFPKANYNQSAHYWTFPGGEQLFFGYFDKEIHYWKYHGFEFPFIAWEELTTWPDAFGYKKMMSCWRSSHPTVPRMYRATTNPYGVGHNWVKKRFRLPIVNGMIGPIVNGEDGDPDRVAIHGHLDENQVLLSAEPGYKGKLRQAARNPQELRAWLHGDWDIVAGGMFDDVWDKRCHVVPSFPIHLVPDEWPITRAYDHGQSKPFSVGWYAESNGEPINWNGKVYGGVRGDLFRIAEWYGCLPGEEDNVGLRMLAREIARGILDREDDFGIAGRVKVGPADSAIFDVSSTGETSVANEMMTAVPGRPLRWEPCNKGKGSRKQGWELCRARLIAAAKYPREDPGFFVLDRCAHFLRTIPVAPRSDKDLDDLDTDYEDHIADEWRYRVRWNTKAVVGGAYR